MRSEEEIRERLDVLLTERARAEAKYAAHTSLLTSEHPCWMDTFNRLSDDLHYWTGQAALLEWVLGTRTGRAKASEVHAQKLRDEAGYLS